YIHSFPTRRSSDLSENRFRKAGTFAVRVVWGRGRMRRGKVRWGPPEQRRGRSGEANRLRPWAVPPDGALKKFCAHDIIRPLICKVNTSTKSSFSPAYALFRRLPQAVFAARSIL